MKPFVRDDNSLLALAVMGQHFAVRPSKVIEIENGTVALDFDLAASQRLLIYENERDYRRLESLIKSLALLATAMLGGEPDGIETPDDKYTDASTQTW